LRKEIILKVFPAAKLDGKMLANIQARLNVALERAEAGSANYCCKQGN
jgi:hypothetical protein